jgi:hypothetical protein
MVLSLAPAAFANPATNPAHPELDTGTLAPESSAKANAKVIKNAKENIEYLYGTLAADNAVFGTIQAVDGIITGLTKELFAGVASINGIPGSTVKSNTNAVLRDYIGSEIIRELDKNRSDYETRSVKYKATLSDGTLGNLTYTGKSTSTGDPIYIDKEGTIYAHNGGGWWTVPAGTSVTAAQHDDISGVPWTAAAITVTNEFKYDPIAYANAFAAAATKAMTSKEGASMMEALAYRLYFNKTLVDMLDADGPFADLRDAVRDWEDGDAILSQYHFHDLIDAPGFDADGFWSPYAMIDPMDFPNNVGIPAAILAP